MSRVVLVSDDLDLERRLTVGLGAARFTELVQVRTDLVRMDPVYAVDELRRSHADVVLLGPRTDPANILAIADLLDRAKPDMVKIVVAEASAEMWELALSVGVRAVLPPDVDPPRLAEAVERGLAVADRRPPIDLRDLALPSSGDERDMAGGPRSRVISVISPKGGSGKTTISTNLAIGLAQRVHDGVAIVDLDLQFGDVADALRLEPKQTIGDIRGRASQLDSAELKLLLSHHESGLFALCAPEDPAIADDICSADVDAALGVLAADYSYVVIDTAAGVDDASLAAIDRSTDLVFVASMEVPSIRNLRKLLATLDRLGIDRPARHLVLNRARSKVGIDVVDVEAALSMPVAVSVPSSKSITMSTNLGAPLVAADPKNAAAAPLRSLADLFTDAPATRASGFAWLRRTR